MVDSLVLVNFVDNQHYQHFPYFESLIQHRKKSPNAVPVPNKHISNSTCKHTISAKPNLNISLASFLRSSFLFYLPCTVRQTTTTAEVTTTVVTATAVVDLVVHAGVKVVGLYSNPYVVALCVCACAFFLILLQLPASCPLSPLFPAVLLLTFILLSCIHTKFSKFIPNYIRGIAGIRRCDQI